MTGTWHQLCCEILFIIILKFVMVDNLIPSSYPRSDDYLRRSVMMQWNPIFSIAAFMAKKTSKNSSCVPFAACLVDQDFCLYLTTLVTVLIWSAMPSTPALGQPECSSRECVIKVEQSVRTQHLEIQYRAEAQTWTSYPDSVRRLNCSNWSRGFGDFQWDVARDIAEGYLKPLKPYSHCRICWFKAKGCDMSVRLMCTEVNSQWCTSLKNKLIIDLLSSIRCSCSVMA